MLARLVVIFLDTAEMRAKNRSSLTIDFWRDSVDKLLAFNDMKILEGKGSISNREMETIAYSEYDEFNAMRKKYDARVADEEDLKLLLEAQSRYKKDNP